MSNGSIWPKDMKLSGAPLRAGVGPEAMAMKGLYSAFPKAPALLETYLHIVNSHIQYTRWGMSYSSAEKQSVYSTAPTEWADLFLI